MKHDTSFPDNSPMKYLRLYLRILRFVTTKSYKTFTDARNIAEVRATYIAESRGETNASAEVRSQLRVTWHQIQSVIRPAPGTQARYAETPGG